MFCKLILVGPLHFSGIDIPFSVCSLLKCTRPRPKKQLLPAGGMDFEHPQDPVGPILPVGAQWSISLRSLDSWAAWP